MFSMTTMESSTTRPIAIVRALRVNRFSEYPKPARPIKVTRSEVGIEIAVTRVERHDLRKIRMMMTAKRRPSSPSWIRSSIDFSTNGAWLNVSLIVTLPPSLVFSSSSKGLIALEIETVLPS